VASSRVVFSFFVMERLLNGSAKTYRRTKLKLRGMKN
jgi:hypothetical protein